MADDVEWIWDDEQDDTPAPGDRRDDEDNFAVRTFDSETFAAPQPVRNRRRPPAPRPDGRIELRAAPALSVPAPRRAASISRSTARRSAPPGQAWWATLRTLIIVLMAAVLISTIFSLWTRPDFFTDEFRAGLNQVQATQRVISIQPSPLPTEMREVRIGIIAGHSGPPQDTSFEVDPGAVCPDGLTELEINQGVAREVVAALRRLEYEVDLLQEFDDRLKGYQADVLVSIHTNDCSDYGPEGTGFNAASAFARQTTRGEDEALLNCLITQYGATTGLPLHGGLTDDMTSYHTFDEVAVDTPTAILELGFMRNNRDILTRQQSLLAQGVVNGILCFLQPELYASS